MNRQQGSATEVLASLAEEAPRSGSGLKLVEGVLDKARVTPDAIEAVVVGLGPGSYTGIRSSIALAQGWQLGRAVQTFGIGTVDALAWQCQTSGCFGTVAIVIDAHRNECYLANHAITPDARQLLEPLRLVDLPTLRACLAKPGIIPVGPEVTKWAVEGKVLFPEAESLGRLLDASGRKIPGEQLEPIYLREISFVKAPPPRFPGL